MADPLLISYASEHAGARLRLFCFPFAGAGASIFRDWSLDLPSEVQVFGVQLPGRESRLEEQPFREMLPAVRAIVAVLRRYQDLPFAFFGHSVGALIAFEVARELRRLCGMSPVHLFVSGYRGPSRPPPEAPVHQLPDPLLMQELRKLGGTPPEILHNNEVMQLMLPAIRGDFALSENYQYERHEPLQCPITVFGGLQDRKVRNSDLPAWQSETKASFGIRMFPGDHYFIRQCRVPLLCTVADELGFGARSKAALSARK
jgi:surfactin synthase thioesterase subunit